MDSCFILQVIFLTISFGVRGTHHAACETGEPINNGGDIAPDLNITLSPELFARVGDELNITCITDKPRYKSGIRPSGSAPSSLSVIFNGKEQRTCPTNRNGRIICIRTVPLTEAAKNVSVVCFARNNNGCRTKTLFVTILEKFIQTPSFTATLVKLPSSQVMSSQSVDMMPSSSSVVYMNFTSQIPSIESSPSSMLIFPSTSTTTNTGGSEGIQNVEETPSFTATLVKLPSSQVMSSQSVDMMPSSSSVVYMNFISQIPLIESSPSSMLIFPSTSTTTNTGGSEGKQNVEDEDEVDNVKKLITATLILVIITLVLMAVAIVYVLRKIRK